MDDNDDWRARLQAEAEAKLAAGDDAGARAVVHAMAERARLEHHELDRELTFLHWSQEVRRELESTASDPLRRRVLERRREIKALRDAEEALRSVVERWPVLRRDAFPPGEAMDTAFSALLAATPMVERAADELTTALWCAVPPSRKAESHRAMQEAALAAQGEFPTLDAWRARDKEKMHRRASEAEAEARLARAHHVEAADVDELIIAELIRDGASEEDAIRATIDESDFDTAKGLKRRKDARRKWRERHGDESLHLRLVRGAKRP